LKVPDRRMLSSRSASSSGARRWGVRRIEHVSSFSKAGVWSPRMRLSCLKKATLSNPRSRRWLSSQGVAA
jgi:hypothetical protein